MKEIILEGLNEKIYEYSTKCGLKVYMWVNERVTSTFMSLSVKYGSIHNKFKIGKKVYEVPNGVAHFLEHIKFNIDANTVAHDEFYKLGADSNAFTTFEYTSYIVYATKNLDKVLNLLLDYVYNPYFTKKMITKEKGIILEEANMTEDDPYSVIFYENLKSVLQKSNFREVITGTKDDIKEISSRLSIKNATETIEMEDIPTQAIKHKKDSSMVVGFNLLKQGKGDVFISARKFRSIINRSYFTSRKN